MFRFLNATVGAPVTPGGFPNLQIRATTKTPASNEDPSNYSRFAAVGAEKSYPVYFAGTGGVVLVFADADATGTVSVIGSYIADTTAGGTVLGTVANPKLAPTASQHIAVPVGIEYVWISHAGISAGGPVRACWFLTKNNGNA